MSHVSWAQAYKAHVGGVSSWYGIEQIHEAWAKVDNTCQLETETRNPPTITIAMPNTGNPPQLW